MSSACKIRNVQLMAKTPHIAEFKYKDKTLIRSAAMSWKPAKYPLGPGATATVAAGPSRGFLASGTFLTVTTPAGDAIVIEGYSSKDAAKMHKLAAQITADAR